MSGFTFTYFMQAPGVFKPAELVLSLALLIVVAIAGAGISSVGFIWFVIIASLISTAILVLSLATDVADTVNRTLSWPLIEMGHNGIWTIGYFICMWLCVFSFPYLFSGVTLAALVCLVTFAVFACDFWVFYKQWRQDQMPSVPPPNVGGQQQIPPGFA